MSSFFNFTDKVVSLYWRGYHGNQGKFWYPKDNENEKLVRFFLEEAGLDYKSRVKLSNEDADIFIAAAGKHEYTVEFVGSVD